MAKFELDSKGRPAPNPKVSESKGFELDIGGAAPPVYPGHGGDNGSHVSNYPTGNAFVSSEPTVGQNTPGFAPKPVDSTGGIKMRNDQRSGDNASMPSFGKFDGAEHRIFGKSGSKVSLSTDGQGRGIENKETTVELFGGNEGQRDMNPPMPRKMGGGSLKGYS